MSSTNRLTEPVAFSMKSRMPCQFVNRKKTQKKRLITCIAMKPIRIISVQKESPNNAPDWGLSAGGPADVHIFFSVFLLDNPPSKNA